MPYDEGGPEVPVDRKPLTIQDDIVMYGSIPVGQVADDGRLLTLNLGWCRLAGLSIRVEDDPQHDNHRSGVALARDYGERA